MFEVRGLKMEVIDKNVALTVRPESEGLCAIGLYILTSDY
jgi:hypothetical protein